MTASTANEVIIIESKVEDYKKLIMGLSPDIPVILLPESGDGLALMANALIGYDNLSAIHLVSHGSDGNLLLGSSPVDSTALLTHQNELVAIASHLVPGADVLLYGCSVVSTEEGRNFVDSLATALGADVAASTDITGAVSLGGDWDLEYATGEIDSILPFTVAGQSVVGALGTSSIFTYYNYISVGESKTGGIDFNGDWDSFRVDLVAGRRYTFELNGSDTSEGTLSDPQLYLYDTSGVLITSDDDSGTGWNSLISYTATSSGTYYIVAAEHGDDAAGTYTLKVTWLNTPPSASYQYEYLEAASMHTFGENDFGFVDVNGDNLAAISISWLPTMGTLSLYGAPLNAGDIVSVTDIRAGALAYYSGSPLVNTTTNFGFFVQDDSVYGQAWSNYSYGFDLYVSPTIDYIGASQSILGAIDVVGDRDTFRIDLVAGNSYTFELNGSDTSEGTLLDPHLYLFDSSGLLITSDDDTGTGLNSLISYTASSSNTYYIVAAKHGDDAAGTFTLKASDVTPNRAPTGTVTISSYFPLQNQILIVSNDLTDADGLGTVSYQWNADSIAISGATSNIFMPSQAQVGKSITVTVSYIDQRGTPESKASVATATVIDVNDAPTIGGVIAAKTVNDNVTVNPFSTFTLIDPDFGANETVTITLDNATKGAFTTDSLIASGFSTTDGGITYSHAAGTPAGLQTALQALVYKPASNRVAIGTTETTNFTIAVNDVSSSTGFINEFSPANWISTLNGGTVSTVGIPNSISVTSSDDGFGPDTTTYQITVPVATKLSFDWNYSTFDGAEWDYAQYSINGVVTTLVNSGSDNQSGTVNNLVLSANSIFAFQMYSTDGLGGAATLSISNFASFAVGSANTTTSVVSVSVNDAPTGTNKSVTLNEDSAYPFVPTDFGYADSDSNPMASVKITSLPVAGSLTLSGSAVVLNQVIAAASVSSLVFTPATNANGTGYANFNFTVNDGSIDSVSANTVSFNVSAVNDAPVAVNLNTAEVYTEDTVLNLADIVATDVDSANVTATLTLSNTAAGSLSTATFGAVTSTFGAGVWSATGAIADINALLAGVIFTSASNFNGNFAVSTSISDGTATVTGSKSFTGIPVNDAPVATNLNTAEIYTEDTVLNLTDIVATDVDSANVTATLTLSNTAAGSLSTATATSGAVTSTFGAGVWSATGAIADINALLAGVIFTPASNFNGNFAVSTSISDGTATVTGSKSFTGIPVNDAPVATNLNTAETYTEDTVLNLTDIVATDVDSANVTATLTLSNTAAGSLSTTTSGAVTSTFGAGVWSATGAIADINALLAGVIFTPASNFNGNFAVSTSISDGTATVTGSKSFTGIPVNDAPVATNLNTAEIYTEDTVLNLTDIVATDVDSATVTATLTLSNTAAGSLSTATATSGAVTSTFGAGVWSATGAIADINALLAGVIFTPASNFNGNFAVSTSISDGTAAVTGSKSFTGMSVDDVPTLTKFTSTVAVGNEDSDIKVIFGNLQSQGNEADDGVVESFVIKAVNSGSLKIGSSPKTAKAWNATTNNSVDATHNAYWAPAKNANGTLNAFTVVAKDNSGLKSETPIQVKVNVKPVNDGPTGTVTITGKATQGEILTAQNTLDDVDGLDKQKIRYIWKAGTTVLGAGDTYNLAQKDVGKTITVTASYIDTLGKIESKTSVATGQIKPQGPDVIITPNDLNTNENGDTVELSVQLATPPTVGEGRFVRLLFSSTDHSEGEVTKNSTLTFNSSNWNVPQTVTVTGQNDYELDHNVQYAVNILVSPETTDVKYLNVTINPIDIINGEDVTAEISTPETHRIAAGTARDTPFKLYGDSIVDETVIDPNTGAFKVISQMAAPDVLRGLDGNDTLFGLDYQDDLSGGRGDDYIQGGNERDFLYGEDGNDTLLGEMGPDLLRGGSGNDTLNGGVEDLMTDDMDGGAGDDTYYVGYSKVDVINDTGPVTDIDTVFMPFDMSSYILPPTIEDCTIFKGVQAGNLKGNANNNTLTGNDGKNTLNGAGGLDSLIGGAGNDVLIGGAGNDVLTGGSGKDIFKFNAALTGNTDKIKDFNIADDTIQLENSIFTKLIKAGMLNAGNFVKAAAAQDANDYIIYNSGTGSVTYDANGFGAGTGVQIALLGVNLDLNSTDFMVI